MKKPLSRRALLRGAGGAALGLPFLEAMLPSRVTAATAPKRFVAFYTPNGTIPKDFWPAGTGSQVTIAAAETLSPILDNLKDHFADLLVLGGLDNLASLEGPGDAHQRGTGSCLTGAPLLMGDFVGMGGTVAGWGSARSVDEEIAAVIGADTTFRSKEFGVGVIGAHVGTRVAYRDSGNPLPPENSPYRMYKSLFGGAEASEADKERLTMRRQLVLNLVLDEANRLKNRLGAGDREKLEAHLESVSEVEARLTKPGVVFGGNCEPLDLGTEENVYDSKNYPDIADLQMRIMSLAFACDLTRVATLMWTFSASPVVYRWVTVQKGNSQVAVKEGHHTIAHKGDELMDYVNQNTAINAFYAGELAKLIGYLKGIDEGGQSIFANSSILWANEHSTGNDHSREDMPYVIAGSAGGHFKPGRYLRYAPKPEDRENNERGLGHNRLLVSLAQAYGVESDTVGSAKYGEGPLSNLT